MEQKTFSHKNNVKLCGKIVRKIEYKDRTLVVLSCRSQSVHKDKNGNIKGDLISVTFYDVAAQFYSTRFDVGDFVVVNGFLTYKDRRTNVIGISMFSQKKRKNHEFQRQMNSVQISGKVESAVKLSDNYILLNILSDTEKAVLDFNAMLLNKKNGEKMDFAKNDKDVFLKNKQKLEDGKFKFDELVFRDKNIRTIIPIGVRCPKGFSADDMLITYTQGTRVDIYGFIKAHRNGAYSTNRTFAKKIYIAGNIQNKKKGC